MLTTTKMVNHPYATGDRGDYLATQVATASPVQLTLLLFDGTDRYLHAAVSLLESGMGVETTPVVTEALARSVAIVYQLMDTLDLEVWPEGETLQAVYNWLSDELVQVNVAKKVITSRATAEDREHNVELSRRVERVRAMLAEIGDAFRQARKEMS